MKPLATQSNIQTDDDCASLVLMAVPGVMRFIKCKMRSNRPAEMSVPQFRSLIFISKRNGASISDVAEHLGLALSTTSKLIDGLVRREYVERTTSKTDRRRAIVSLTTDGQKALGNARTQAYASITERLSGLSAEEEQALSMAMRALHRVFGPAPKAEAE